MKNPISFNHRPPSSAKLRGAKSRLWISLLGLTVAIGVPSFALDSSDPTPVRAVTELDLNRYLGRWYEIAKYPNRFQKHCISDTTADYRALNLDRIEVLNRCRQSNGLFDEALGEARKVSPDDSARLEVRFAPKWLSFLPFVWGDYWVIDLDPNYEWSVVSEPKRDYLWILSRTPQIDATVLSGIVKRLKERGFDTNRLEMTVHTSD